MKKLEPQYCNRQKSFYGKAFTEIKDNIITLYSYNTKIMSYDYENGNIDVYWNGYSKTTLEHINAFVVYAFNGSPFNKKEWLEFASVKPDECYRVTVSNGFFEHTTSALYGDYSSAENAANRISNNSGLYAFID